MVTYRTERQVYIGSCIRHRDARRKTVPHHMHSAAVCYPHPVHRMVVLQQRNLSDIRDSPPQLDMASPVYLGIGAQFPRSSQMSVDRAVYIYPLYVGHPEYQYRYPWQQDCPWDQSVYQPASGILSPDLKVSYQCTRLKACLILGPFRNRGR